MPFLALLAGVLLMWNPTAYVAQPKQSDNTPGEQIRISVAQGVSSDTNEQRVVVSDIMNMVLTPDGSALESRGCLELRMKTSTLNVPEGMVAIMKDTNPPDIDNLNLFMVIDGSAIVNMSFMRDRTQLESEELMTTIQTTGIASPSQFDLALAGESTPGDVTPGQVDFYRTGELSQAASAVFEVITSDFPYATITELNDWLSGNPILWAAGDPFPNPFSGGMDFYLSFPNVLPNGPLGPYTITLQLRATSFNTEVDPEFNEHRVLVTITEI